MPGLNTTIDASEALAAVIAQRYDRDITGDLWNTMSPAGAPPGGLGSSDTSDWWLTLDEASKRMAAKGYQMSPISHPEAEAARTAKLDASVAVLVKKAKVGPPAASKDAIDDAQPVEADARVPISTRQRIALALGVTALIALASGIRKLMTRGQR